MSNRKHDKRTTGVVAVSHGHNFSYRPKSCHCKPMGWPFCFFTPHRSMPDTCTAVYSFMIFCPNIFTRAFGVFSQSTAKLCLNFRGITSCYYKFYVQKVRGMCRVKCFSFFGIARMFLKQFVPTRWRFHAQGAQISLDSKRHWPNLVGKYWSPLRIYLLKLEGP